MKTRNPLPNLHSDPQAALDDLPVAIYSRYSANPNGTIDSVGNQNDGGIHYVGLTWGDREYRIYADDDASASSAEVERPAFNQMRADIRAGLIGAVVGKSQSRFLRNEIEWSKLRQDCLAAGIDQWHCWGKGGIVDIGRGRAIKSKIDLAIDSDYGETVSVNVRKAQEVLARKGKANGGVCFGYVRGPRPAKGGATLVPDPETGHIPQEIFERVLAGETIQAIADDLTRREIPTVRGRAFWRCSTVRVLLRAPTLTGLRVYQAQVIGEGDWEAIVDRGTWDAMQVHLGTPGSVTARDGRRKKRGYTNGHTRYLLSDIALCPHCGSTLTGSKRSGRSPMYLCSKSRGGCERTSVTVRGVDGVVVARLLSMLAEPKFRRYLAAKDPHQPKRDALMAELDEIEVERQQDAADKAAKRMSRATWMASASALDDRQDQVQRELAGLPAPKGHIDPDLVIDSWGDLELTEQRRIIRACIQMVKIAPAKHRGGNQFDASRVRVTRRTR